MRAVLLLIIIIINSISSSRISISRIVIKMNGGGKVVSDGRIIISTTK